MPVTPNNGLIPEPGGVNIEEVKNTFFGSTNI